MKHLAFLVVLVLVASSVWAQGDDNSTDTTSDNNNTEAKRAANDTSPSPHVRQPQGRNATLEAPGPSEVTAAGLPRHHAHRRSHKLNLISNRTDFSQLLYPVMGFGKADLWFNTTEVLLMYRARFYHRDLNTSSDTDANVNETAESTSEDRTRASDSLPQTIIDRASHTVGSLESFFNDIGANVIESSGLQYFPIFGEPLRSRFRRGRMAQPPVHGPTPAPGPTFINPALAREKQAQAMREPHFMQQFPDQFPDQPMPPMEPPTVSATEAFAQYRIQLPLAQFADLVRNLGKYNASISEIRLIASRESQAAAREQALQDAVDDALLKADEVFDALGVSYKGLYNFRAQNSHIPHLPPIKISSDTTKLPPLKAIKVPIYSRVLLMLSY